LLWGQSRDDRDVPDQQVSSRADASNRTDCDRGEGAKSCHLVKARERQDMTAM